MYSCRIDDFTLQGETSPPNTSIGLFARFFPPTTMNIPSLLLPPNLGSPGELSQRKHSQ